MKKKKALRKEFHMEIRRSLNRFLSIFFIVAMGVAFFSGIQASAPDMRATGDYYYDQNHLMDLKVLGTLGLTEDDLRAIGALDGISLVRGSYMEDVYCGEQDAQQVLHIESLTEGINEVTVTEGRLPETTGECVLDQMYAEKQGYQVGDTIRVTPDKEDTALKQREFTVSGIGHSPAYIAFERGSTTLGSGSVAGFLYVQPETFDSEVYHVAYAHVTGAEAQMAYTDGYEALVEEVLEQLESMEGARCEIRYEEVMDEAQEKLDDAKQEVADGEQELADARKELDDGKAEAESELAEAESELISGESELADGRQELADSEQELIDGEQELADGETQIADNEGKMQDARTKLADARSQLSDGEDEYRSGLAQYQKESSAATGKLEDAQAQIDSGKAALEDGWQEYYAQEAVLADGEQQLVSAESELTQSQQAYEDGAAQLAGAQAQYEDGAAQLAEGWASYETGAAQLAAGRRELETKERALEEAQKEYEDGAAQLAAAQAEYQSAEDAYAAQDQAYQEDLSMLKEERTAYESQKAAADGLQQQCAEKEQAIQALETERAAAEAKKQSAAEQKVSKETEQSTQQAALDGKAAEKVAAEAELEQILQDPEATEEEKAAAKQKVDALAAEIAQIQSVLSELAAEISGLAGQIADAQGTIDSADAALPGMREELEGLQKQASDARNALVPLLEALQQHEAASEAAGQALEKTKGELALWLAGLNEKSAALDASKAQLDAGLSALEQAKTALEEEQGRLDAAQKELSAQQAGLDAVKAQLDTKKTELGTAKAQLDAGWQQLAAEKEKAASGKEQLAGAKQQLESNQAVLDASQKEVDKGKKELQSAKKKLNAARKKLDVGWAELHASQSQLADGERQLSDARSALADAREKLADGRTQIEDAKREIAENEQKLADGWVDYEEGKKEAEQELADGEQKIADAEQELLDAKQEIADAEQELAELNYPKWYVYDRNELPDNTGFGENADRLTNIAKVFPVIFFLVAALISLTTMTRMVEEERTQIGTMKALGYSKWDIAAKYLKYAFYATLGGSVFGVLIGEKIFPWIIVNAYGIMYQYLPKILVPYDWSYGVRATAAALLCTMAATLSACAKELQAVPAELMRPPSPKEGKRVLLERLPFVWKHLSFTWKSTVRNLMRYKKRFLMTVIGIGGCMGLLLVGYGIRDSIMDVAVLQFDELQLYDAMTVIDPDAEPEEQEEAFRRLEEDGRVLAGKRFLMQKEDIRDLEKSRKEWSVYLYVPENLEHIDEFFCFRDRRSKEQYTLNDEGAIITEKIAKEFGVKPGETITLQNEDETVEIPVAAVCENYLYHYIYLTPTLYEQVYGKAPEYNSAFYCAEGGVEAAEEIGRELLRCDAVLNVTYTKSLKAQLDHMLGALDVVIVVLIVSAGMLAFVVLYNLNNININERKRELATIKVLGFYDGEVAAYVYRENILLTIVGAAVGIFIGKFLHLYIIRTVEVDMCMFGRNILPQSFVIGTLFTFAFSLIVNLAMYYKLKKIDMVESLKSVE